MKKVLFLVLVLVFLCLNFFTAKAQNMYTLAGTGIYGYSGDGGTATNAQLSSPQGVALDAAGNIYISDLNNHRIRKVNTSGIISTFAGTGVSGFSGDGAASTNAKISIPYGVTVDGSGNVYIADFNNNRIRKVNTSGFISTVAGTGIAGFSGDGGAATNAQLNGPTGISCDLSGNLYISDNFNHRIRKINNSGIISTFAGTGIQGYSGDGGLATAAQLNWPISVNVDPFDNVYISDQNNHRIRKVNTSEIISTFAGTGAPGFTGDFGSATSAQLNLPYEVAFDASNNVYISDRGNNRVRKINSSGIISTYAGTGAAGFSGDGGTPISAQLFSPQGIAINMSGNLFIADRGNHRVREICSVSCITSINSITENNTRVLIFPNPTKDKITIESTKTELKKISISNSLAQIVCVFDNLTQNQEIDISSLSSGVYFLRIENETVNSTFKIFKE